ncbi:MAG: hypothetical protein KIS74_01370 [Burkholderiales bacterium]|nr:hypothetical protein [Burkholderiales bacterium]
MKSDSRSRTSTAGRRAVAGLVAAATLLASGLALAGQVILTAPSTTGITFSTGTNSATAICAYENALFDKDGNVTISCTGAPLSQLGTLALNLAGTKSSIPVSTGSTTFAITRTGGVLGRVDAALDVTPGCALTPYSVTFLDGTASPVPPVVTLSPGTIAAGGNCVVTLTSINAPVGTPNTFTVAVTAPASVLSLNASGTAASILPSTGSTTIAVARSGGTSGAVTANLAVSGGCSLSASSVSFAEASSTPSPATVTVSAGSATAGGNCVVTLTAVSPAQTGVPATQSIGIGSAGTLALSTASLPSIPVSTGSTSFSVTRTGGTDGAVTANLTVTGGCQLSSPTASFPAGNSSPATITVSAGSAAANTSCNISLAAVSPASTGSPSSASVSITQPSTAGTLALNVSATASSIPVSTGSTSFSVTRTGGTDGAVTANISISGGCTPSATTVTFAAGSSMPSPSSVTVGAGTAAGGSSCTITLSAVSPASNGTPNTHPIGISSNTPPVGCTTTATQIVSYVPDQTNQMQKDLKAGENLAILVDSSVLPLLSRPNYYMGVVPFGSMDNGADIQFTVSTCPGDFAAGVTYGPNCAKHTGPYGDSITFLTGTPPGGKAPPACYLPSGTTKFYFNIRPIKLPTPSPPDAPGTPSCPSGMLCRFLFALSR